MFVMFSLLFIFFSPSVLD